MQWINLSKNDADWVPESCIDSAEILMEYQISKNVKRIRRNSFASALDTKTNKQKKVIKHVAFATNVISLDNLRTPFKNLSQRQSSIQKPRKPVTRQKSSKENCKTQNDKSNENISNNFPFEVEKVLDDKLENGRRFYLIKWRGYDHSQNTWEPKSSFAFPHKILAGYRKCKS